MILQLHDLHPLSPNILANELQALLFQTLLQDWIHLKPVAVPLFQVVRVSVELPHDRVLGLEQGSPLAQPHGSAHLPGIVLRHVYDHRMIGLRVKLRRIGILPSQHIS